MDIVKSFALGALATILCAPIVHAGTLEDARAAGRLKCGIPDKIPGFADEGPDGQWIGLDVDTCRAIAAAVLGDADKVDYIVLSAKERFTALQAGEVDVLARRTTWREGRHGLLHAIPASASILPASISTMDKVS